MHLSDYMIQNCLNDDDVAAAIGCSRPTISRIRRRLVRPKWDTIEKLKEFTRGQSTADDYSSLEVSQ